MNLQYYLLKVVLVLGKSSIEFMASNIEKDEDPHIYKNVIVAEKEGCIVGITVAAFFLCKSGVDDTP